MTVTVSATAVSPANTNDFTISANKDLTIAAGSTSSSGTVTITAVDNSVDAANKTGDGLRCVERRRGVESLKQDADHYRR